MGNGYDDINIIYNINKCSLSTYILKNDKMLLNIFGDDSVCKYFSKSRNK